MFWKISGIVAALASLSAGWCQAPAPLTFEVASIKPANAPVEGHRNQPGVERLEFRYATLWYCITYAYGKKSYQVFGGPEWVKTAHYDIVAKGPAGTRRDQLPEMMQRLLAERFKLQVHRETRKLPALALIVGKNGPKLMEAEAGSGDGQGGTLVGMSATEEGSERMDVKAGSMSTLVNMLSSVLGRPVVDQTGLGGRYDFVFEFTRDEATRPTVVRGYGEPPSIPAPRGKEPGLSIYTSIQQLGLKLDARKLPLEVIVIDQAEKTPTEN
jgi:uncharacterized protein (TIGR03435 family)